jgi:prepilin-type N-terminal cleavage/methylation domain-containing protein
MKTAILLKFLQSCDNTATPNFPKTRSRKGDNGYTLLELLVVVIMLGILASIAAPGWLGFINRQRVRTVNDRVFQSLRLAQSEAKRTKQQVTITFNPATATDPPTIKFNPPLATGGETQTLNAGGEIKPGTITLVSNAPSITFDYLGNVKDELPIDTSVNPKISRFKVAVAAVNGGGKQCAIVETIIGGMRTGEGPECTTTP